MSSDAADRALANLQVSPQAAMPIDVLTANQLSGSTRLSRN